MRASGGRRGSGLAGTSGSGTGWTHPRLYRDVIGPGPLPERCLERPRPVAHSRLHVELPWVRPHEEQRHERPLLCGVDVHRHVDGHGPVGPVAHHPKHRHLREFRRAPSPVGESGFVKKASGHGQTRVPAPGGTPVVVVTPVQLHQVRQKLPMLPPGRPGSQLERLKVPQVGSPGVSKELGTVLPVPLRPLPAPRQGPDPFQWPVSSPEEQSPLLPVVVGGCPSRPW